VNAPAIRVRKNVLTLPAGDPTLAQYSAAVASMLAKPLNEPTGWRYQAAIHGYPDDNADDPLSTPGDAYPTPQQILQFWRQCQHGSWYFLPWHRMYLYHFESMVAAEVNRLFGVTNWALPYWDYFTPTVPLPTALPAAFRRPDDPAFRSLFVAARSAKANAGGALGPYSLACLDTIPFITALANTVIPGFGGPVTAFQHEPLAFGDLENNPHNRVHTQVGGQLGWMSDPDRAALDPIFWLHHANIDRLWGVWLRKGAGRLNPTLKTWSTRPFWFNTVDGRQVQMTPEGVLDTVADLGYRYDDDPTVPRARAAAAPRPAARAAKRATRMVAATTTGLSLGQTATQHAVVASVKRKVTARSAMAAAPTHTYLSVENVKAPTLPSGYDVYLNLPAKAKAGSHPDRLAGHLSMFGVVGASTKRSGRRGHAGNGLSFVFEITKVVETLVAAKDWDPSALRVTFVPTDLDMYPGKVKVEVGRVSVHVE
jgi:tyrosinase